MPAIVILLFVKSFILADSAVNCPAIYVSPVGLLTVKFPSPTLKSIPSNVKFTSSSSSPFVPTITILSFVKSSTLTLAKVDCPSTCNVPLISASPVAVKSFTIRSVPRVLQLSNVSSQTKNTLSSSPRNISNPTSSVGTPVWS